MTPDEYIEKQDRDLDLLQNKLTEAQRVLETVEKELRLIAVTSFVAGAAVVLALWTIWDHLV